VSTPIFIEVGALQSMSPSEDALAYAELREIMSADKANAWLKAPHPRLGLRRPVDCDFTQVMRVIDQLKSGAFI